MPSSSMYWTMTPISSMCPSSMIVGLPLGFTSAMLLPATSEVTTSANALASSRQTRAAGPSKPEGPGVSSRRLRNASDDGESTGGEKRAGGRRSGGGKGSAPNREYPISDCQNTHSRHERTVVACQAVIQDPVPGDHLSKKDAVEAVG